MSNAILTSTLLFGPVAVLAGVAFGLVYFRALRWTVAFISGGRGLLRPAGLTIARIVAALVFLTAMAQLGAMTLLASFVGFLLARMIALRAEQRAG